MSKIWFTSYLHLGHVKTATHYRGYSDVVEHDVDIIDTIGKHVGKRDVLWVLGDLSFTESGVSELLTIGTRDQFRFVRGNHDTFPTKMYNEVFREIHGFTKYKGMWLSHCPIHPQEMFRAEANIHGHIHKDALSDNLGYPYINVNWDFWRRPICMDEIKSIISAQYVSYD